MYHFAPIPSWADLISGLLVYLKKAEPLAAPWIRNEQHIALFSNGTAIMDYIVKQQAAKIKSRKPIIWLPDYFSISVKKKKSL